jgi:hypothetical protein
MEYFLRIRRGRFVHGCLQPEKCRTSGFAKGALGKEECGGGGYAEFNVPFCFNRLPFHFMIELIPKFVNAVGKSERVGRDMEQAEMNVMKSYVPLNFATRCRMPTKQMFELKRFKRVQMSCYVVLVR